MKKHLKSLLKSSVILVILGTVMMMLGILFGGVGELSTQVSELVTVVRTGVVKTVERLPMLDRLANINGFTLVIDKDQVSFTVNEKYETLTGDYQNFNLAKSDEVNNLDISVLSGDFSVLPSENGQYGVECRGDAQFQCYVEDETLFLGVFPTSTVGGHDMAEVILYVPAEESYEKIFLFCSGNETEIKVPLRGEEMQLSVICGNNAFEEEITVEQFNMNVGVGSVEIEQVSATDINVEVSNAEVDLENITADSLSVSVGMGTLVLNGETSGNIDISCGMGNLQMMLRGMQEEYNYDISGSAESVQIGSDTLAGMVMERWIDNGSNKKITMSCSMGNVKIEFVQ